MNNEYSITESIKRIEDELMASMIRNLRNHRAEEIAEGYNWEQWQVKQLEALERYKKRNAKKYGNEFKDINQQIGALLTLARQEGDMSQEIKILNAIKNGFKADRVSPELAASFFLTNDRKLEALINATVSDMGRAETAILRMANDKYRRIIFDAQMYANSGAGTYEKAVDMATLDMRRAGLNCVEYKNGARHTLSDYADMAIRTASKRAYLYGEGEKRQEWGIGTVIMVKRGNPCPKCAPFVGRVLIDDVWSGGKPDGKHKLMSDAIKAGLYHPRCKDSHTTYFDGITEEDPYTEEEREELEEEYVQEQRENYYRRHAEQCDRIGKYALDSDNHRTYVARRKQWENVVANSKKNDIMESDLSVFKSKLRNDEDISKEYYGILKEKFSHGRKEAKHLFAKYAGGDTIETSLFEGIAHFDTETKKISMHYGADLNNLRCAGATWFHEHGHLIDDALGTVSNDKKFKELLEYDVFQYRKRYGKEHNLKTYDKVDKSISGDLHDMRKHSAVSDLLDVLTSGNIRGCANHPSNYWNDPENITSEAFAHMFEAQFDEVRYDEMKKYFPQSLEYFEKKLKEVAK